MCFVHIVFRIQCSLQGVESDVDKKSIMNSSYQFGLFNCLETAMARIDLISVLMVLSL